MIKKRTISDYIVETMIQEISSLELPPGTKLSETTLAKKYNVSRAPVHDALAKLEHHGLVDVVPQSGTFVSQISAKRAEDICDVRIQLETYAVEIAAARISNEQISKLQELFDKLLTMEANSEERSQFVSEVDIYLHNMIFEICGNCIIPKIIEDYRPEIQRIRRANIRWANREDTTQVEMRKIFDALKNHDSYAARIAMQEHILNIKIAVKTFALS